MEPKLLAKGVRYQRHRPEQTLLYQIVERYYPELTQFMARQGKRLPNYIQQEFDDFACIVRKWWKSVICLTNSREFKVFLVIMPRNLTDLLAT